MLRYKTQFTLTCKENDVRVGKHVFLTQTMIHCFYVFVLFHCVCHRMYLWCFNVVVIHWERFLCFVSCCVMTLWYIFFIWSYILRTFLIIILISGQNQQVFILIYFFLSNFNGFCLVVMEIVSHEIWWGISLEIGELLIIFRRDWKIIKISQYLLIYFAHMDYLINWLSDWY